jgi:hypothetical protein
MAEGIMRCQLCGEALYPLRFGVWLIWLSLESGQVCSRKP